MRFEWVWRVVDWCGRICVRWSGVILVWLGSEEACGLEAKRRVAWKWCLGRLWCVLRRICGYLHRFLVCAVVWLIGSA